MSIEADLISGQENWLNIPPSRKVDLFDQRHTFQNSVDEQTRQVHIGSRITLEEYAGITPADDRKMLISLAGSLGGNSLSWVNSTSEGGGVAIMRSSQIHLLRLLGIEARWYVTEPDEYAFQVTKKIHNILQGVAKPGVRLSAEDREIYRAWTDRNAAKLAKPLAASDVVIIDDPQPAGLISHILEANPDVRLIFRSHIQSEGGLMSKAGTEQHETWDFIWRENSVNRADCFVYHPVPEFVPGNVPAAKTVFMPPSTNLLDDLNRPLTSDEIDAGIAYFNGRLNLNNGQEPLDPKRPRIIQIARFDPSKGIPLVLESYRALRNRLSERGVPIENTPQLVITGNGSIDDPDGLPMQEETMRLRSQIYADLAEDIKVAKIPHNDQALNALLRSSWIALQLSTKEGFEFKVSEALMMGVPVIANRVGGIPLQIVDGVTGYLVNSGDTEAVAAHLERLFLDKQSYLEMKGQIGVRSRTDNYEFTTIPNVINWLFLIRELLQNQNFSGYRRSVREMVKGSF